MKGSLLELSLPVLADGGGQEEGDAAKNYAKILPAECTVKLDNYALLLRKQDTDGLQMSTYSISTDDE